VTLPVGSLDAHLALIPLERLEERRVTIIVSRRATCILKTTLCFALTFGVCEADLDDVDAMNAPRAAVHHTVTTLTAHSRSDSPERSCRRKDRTSTAPLPASPAYAGASEQMVSAKPLGSVTSNVRLFHSVS